MNKKPDPRDNHQGCMLHDMICIDEQMKAGCAVEIFICFNCRFMMLHDGDFKEQTEMIGNIANMLFVPGCNKADEQACVYSQQYAACPNDKCHIKQQSIQMDQEMRDEEYGLY